MSMFDDCYAGYIASLKQKRHDTPELPTHGEASQIDEFDRERNEASAEDNARRGPGDNT